MEDFYRKTFLQGGLTYSQLTFLFESADREKYEELKFLAAVHGLDIEGEQKSQKTTGTDTSNNFKFHDPSEYADWTDEQRQAETDRMMAYWKTNAPKI